MPLSKQKTITTFIAICIIAILVVGVKVTKPTATPSSIAVSQPATSTTTNGTYKDGTYNADGTYNSPGGKESIAVSLTLSNNIVADATVSGNAKGGVAAIYQSYFVNNYKGLAVGKNIDQLKLSRVSGSSLTSKGFNDAVARIKVEAKN